MDWENIPDNIQDCFGFVYLISRIGALPDEPQFYIGCKQFHSKTRKPPLKGKTRKRIVVRESDWRSYYGSSNELLKDIATYGKDAFRREIIKVVSCKWELKYVEMEEQVKRRVLFDRRFFNGIINLRINRCPIGLLDKYTP